MKQRYKWEVRVGGVLLTLKVERVGGINQKNKKETMLHEWRRGNARE